MRQRQAANALVRFSAAKSSDGCRTSAASALLAALRILEERAGAGPARVQCS